MNSSTTDPYAPPLSGAAGVPKPPVEPMRVIVVAWEKLRLLYNGILLIPGFLVLAIAVNHIKPPVAAAVLSIMVGVGANLCFLLGPLAEVYFCALSRKPPSPVLRWWLFGAGTLLSLGVFAFAALAVSTI